MDTVIKVEKLSKQYRIGAREGYKTFRETLVDAAKAPFARLSGAFGARSKEQRAESKSDNSQPNGSDSKLYALSSTLSSRRDDWIWALKDVSFEVKQGDVLGIIGRNGAGKSTLLKILSKITEPTEGRVELQGRVGSLLEVGTGFHPELTGHENIYLYGAILGMDRWEITRKFDEIVAFAELEKFIDTPVKRYSSGMYMRLAFAVAAHLEPEILLVDEVLAVGDAAFQRKCLGKMDDVAKGGRTILFVSHNMQAVQSLCNTAIRLDNGRIAANGDPVTIVSGYLASTSGITSKVSWDESSAPGNDEIKLKYIRVFDETGGSQGIFSSNKDISIEMGFIADVLHPSLCVGYDILASSGEVVARSYQTDLSPEEWPVLKKGENRWRCVIPKGFLNGGVYYIAPRIGMHNMYWIVNMDSAIQFEVVLDHGLSPFWNTLDGKSRPGVVAPIFKWHTSN